jgi:uncharacterized protein (UPF0333 family)
MNFPQIFFMASRTILSLLNRLIHNRLSQESKNDSRGQISIEYLLILGLSLAVLIPASYLFYQYSQGSNEQVVRGQIDTIGSQVLTQARNVYTLGQGNRVTLTLEIPGAVKNITIIEGVELVVIYQGKQGLQEAVYFSNTNITGSYLLDNNPCPGYCTQSKWTQKPDSSGTVDLKIESQGTYVTLNETN